MDRIKVRTHVGPDGVLKLDLPLAFKETDVEVVVVVQSLAARQAATPSGDLGWPPGYLEQTYGSFQDESLVRGEQGEYEIREELE
jgi:hypothetical protein